LQPLAQKNIAAKKQAKILIFMFLCVFAPNFGFRKTAKITRRTESSGAKKLELT
jgi:hypothetical protein